MDYRKVIMGLFNGGSRALHEALAWNSRQPLTHVLSCFHNPRVAS